MNARERVEVENRKNNDYLSLRCYPDKKRSKRKNENTEEHKPNRKLLTFRYNVKYYPIN